MPPAARTSNSPPSNDDDDLEHAGTGIHSRSRNARAQARHRAKRKAYIENLETSVKRLQAIVDANGLDPNSMPPPLPTTAAAAVHGHSHSHPHPYAVHDLQLANAKLQREAEALRVQITALTAHVSAGGHVHPMQFHPSPPGSETHTPPPGVERDHKKRKMSAEREHAPLYLDHAGQGRASPASTSTSSMHTTLPSSLASPSLASSSHSSLAHSMLTPSSLALAQQQAAYHSLFSSLGGSQPVSAQSQSHQHLSSLQNSSQTHGRAGSPPVPVSAFANLPSNSLLASSLYPLLTLGIAGGAVSGELGAATWHAFQQQSQMQAQAAAQNGGSQMGQQHPSMHHHQHPHSSYLSQSQPMSTLSSSLDSSSGLPAMDSSRMGSPSGMQHSLESMRTSSPRYSASSSPGDGGMGQGSNGAGAFGVSSSSSPRFETSSVQFDTRYEPSGSRFETSSTSNYNAPRFDPSNGSARYDSAPRYGQSTSPQFGPSGSPQFAPNATTPPGFGSSSSTPPGSGFGESRRSSSGSLRGEVQ